MSSSKITGIIHTRNESAYIAQAIGSLVGFVDEVLVADMASTDDTVEIARSLGARVIQVPEYGFADPARQLAVDSATYEWIFLLDADEVATPALGTRIKQLAAAEVVDVVSIPRLNYMFGKAIRHSGWSPDDDRQLRFFRRSAMVLTGSIHNFFNVAPGSHIEMLEAEDALSIHHFNYTDWSNFVSKMDRYTSIEAEQLLDRGERPGLAWLVRGSAREFLRRLVWKRGYRDGFEGFALTWLMMTYKLLVFAKAKQLRDKGDAATIRSSYASVAGSIAAGDVTHVRD